MCHSMQGTQWISPANGLREDPQPNFNNAIIHHLSSVTTLEVEILKDKTVLNLENFFLTYVHIKHAMLGPKRIDFLKDQLTINS